MGLGMGQIKQTLGNGTPQLPTVPGFDPSQMSAQEGVLNKSGGILQDVSSALGGAQKFLTGDVMNLDSNPALRQALDATLRPITEQFQNTVMPTLRTGQIQAGALGSPKANARQGLAAGQYMRELGDTGAKFMNTAYGQNLDALTKGVALAPQSLQAILFPESAQEAVGAQRRQLGIDQQQQQGFNQAMMPFNLGTSLISAAAGAPGAGSTSTVQGAQPKTSGWQQALGLGLTAAGAMSGLPFFA